jgi:beta-phosphoglucomutase-like phosphatase (HAD superfamily)
VQAILKSADLEKYFLTILTAEDVKREKQAPDGFLLAAKNLRADPRECVVIEDSEKGVIAAKDAGMKVIATPNKKTSDNDFSWADLIIENIRSLALATDVFKTFLPEKI